MDTLPLAEYLAQDGYITSSGISSGRWIYYLQRNIQQQMDILPLAKYLAEDGFITFSGIYSGRWIYYLQRNIQQRMDTLPVAEYLAEDGQITFCGLPSVRWIYYLQWNIQQKMYILPLVEYLAEDCYITSSGISSGGRQIGIIFSWQKTGLSRCRRATSYRSGWVSMYLNIITVRLCEHVSKQHKQISTWGIYNMLWSK